MKRFVISIIAFFPCFGIFAQQPLQPEINLPSLSPDEEMVLMSIPLLELPEKYKGPDAPLLPIAIDNSTQPYFRPITSQSGLECGQSAGIAFNFTYEIDRLRNVPANTGTNQYPTHFAWDFLNNGTNMGVSCFNSWEVVRGAGTMNVADYGGLSYGGYKRWISGYNFYYNAMGNRLNYMKAIDCQTPEGLLTLKYWLFDHLEGAAVGGVGNFYGNYFSPTQYLPAGTPEAGKCVITSWGSSASHTWTVCGYNDSIRYDYNNDGEYTNDEDINGDGLINMHDWEIGGLKFANGYAGTGWGNQGFCYMMYKTVADAIGYGGIWNNRIYIIDVNQSCNVKMAMKITLKHTSRNKLKVTTGISTNLSATVPDFVQEYPIFNFQGGDNYMQGGATEADKTIEFGLELAELLNNISSGQPVKFFLQVQEVDPTGVATGEIVGWSLMDYTQGPGPIITNYSGTNIPIGNNTTTRLSLNYTPTFTKPDITTLSLPPANLYQPYSFQLAAANGTSPYRWNLKLDYPETVSTAGFPNITTQQLTPTNNNSGYALKTLPFSFPFYNKAISQIYIYVDGYILFDNQPFTWPYIVDKNHLFHYTSIISPFMTDMILYSSQSDGIWYQEDANSVTIRWKSSIYNMQGTSGLNIAVKLYKDGKIEYYYGNMNYPASTSWTGGICSGDNTNYQMLSFNGASSITSGTFVQMAACGFPVEMSLSDDGLFTGTPENVYTNRPVNFRVYDNSNLSNTKILNFSTNGLLLSYTIQSGTDSIIEYGETVNVGLKITNIGNQTVHNVNTWITESDPWITMTDSTAYFGDIGAGQSITVNNAFVFGVNPLVPDDHFFTMTIHLSSTEHNFTKEMDLVAFAPAITSGAIEVLDGDNSRLDPGETTDIKVTYRNQGGAKVQNLLINLTPNDSLLTVNVSSSSPGTMMPDSTITATFNVTSDASAPFEHMYMMISDLSGNNGYTANDSLYLFSGSIIEDFETGTMTKFPWFSSGFGYWYADGLEHYEGNFCSRSGWIYDNEESALNLIVNVLSEGPVSFWRMVSCENDPSGTNYDYLAFFIDNTEMGRWDGSLPWQMETFNITKGYHTLKWVYHKDYSVAAYSDCAWIDFVNFPAFAGGWPVISASPASFDETLDVGQSADETLIVSNTGGGVLDYSVIVFDTAANKSPQAPLNLSGSYIECYTDGFVPGQDITWTFVVHNNSSDNEYIREIKMDFPSGVNVSSSTNFTGGSLGNLITNGVTGNGASITWHGESGGGLGVIKPGETANTVITGNISEDFSDDVFVVYSIRGDNTGSSPHAPGSHVKLKNFSLPNQWLSLTNNIGSILHGQSANINVHFNAAGLPAPSVFSCNMTARDKYNNKVTIPVVMHVEDTTIIIGVPSADVLRFKAFPNPFNEQIGFRYTVASKQAVMAYIADYSGKAVRTLISKVQEAGTYVLTWDGKNENGIETAPGVYILRMQAGGNIITEKLVHLY